MPLRESDHVKIRVTVPLSHADAVRAALGRAGAGMIGKYEYCSTSWRVIGRFFPLPGAHPAIGEAGTMEEAEEEMIETICPKEKIADVVAALKKTHPYEAPAIDILPLLSI